jgi:predicted N-formylglutamate amidohydrolase
MNDAARTLLSEHEPPAFTVERSNGRSPFLLLCDHAGDRIPESLARLGLPPEELGRHIALDIGAAAVTRHLARRFDAVAILQTYSRLVIDCNRPLHSPTSIAPVSEFTVIPGNQAVSAADRERRIREIFWPYHLRIQAELEARRLRGQPTLLIAMHSFTPVFKGQSRALHAGVLYQRDARLAHRLLAELRRDPNLLVGDNEPYSVSDATDYAIPEYGEKRGLPHVEIEVRQDLIGDERGQAEWAERLDIALRAAAAEWLRAPPSV